MINISLEKYNSDDIISIIMLGEKRHSKRAIANLKAEFIADSSTYTGMIENLSEEGICLTTNPTKTARDFMPGTTINLRFQIPSGEIFNLHCLIIWLHTCRIPSHGLTNSMGIKIMVPPLKYKEFYKKL